MGSGEGLGWSLGGFWCLGGVLEALGGLWIDFWRLLDGFGNQNGVNFCPKSKDKSSTNRQEFEQRGPTEPG